MTDISEAERLARILEEAENAELKARSDRARQRWGRPITIDWSTGQRAIFTDNVIPFPKR
jgi:hypothetical protein